MIEDIKTPIATAAVRWLSAAAGGRTSGPPSAPVYAANCTFPLGGEIETIPGWPATAEKFSLLLQKISELPDGSWRCKLDFLVPSLVVGYLSDEATMLVMEGPKVVGTAIIEHVLPAAEANERG